MIPLALSAASVLAAAPFHTRRGSLDNSRIRFERAKRGRVAFLGGSITAGADGWRDRVQASLEKRFPGTEFEFINAGIPSLGSVPDAFRLRRDVLDKGPIDLLFVEAAVNDTTNHPNNPVLWRRGMEGVLRQARRANPNADIVVLYCVDPEKRADYDAGRTPEVIAVHDKVAAHYGVSSIDLAAEVSARIRAGEFSWENDFKDLHPAPFGHRLYAASIDRFLDAVWARPLPQTAKLTAHPMPNRPLDRAAYVAPRMLPPDAARIDSGWRVDPAWKPTDGVATRPGFVAVPMAVTEIPGARLTLPFTGNAVGIWIVSGPDAGFLEFQIDDKPARRIGSMTQWSKGLYLPWVLMLADDLPPGPHTLTLTNVNQACRIVHFLVNENEETKPMDKTWTEVAPGVWKAVFGRGEDYTLLGAAGARPNRTALEALPPAPFPLDPAEIQATPRKGKVSLRLPLAPGEDIYGLGLDFNGVRRNGSVQTLHLDAWDGRTGRTHAPVPFTVSSRGYGVLVNSARYLTYYVGTGVRVDSKHPPTVYDRNNDGNKWQAQPPSDTIEVQVPAEGVEVLIFAGPTPLDAVRRYNLYCGGGCLPPKWGLGFTHRTPTLYADKDVEREAAEFEQHGFPLDFIGLEPGWHDHSYPCSFEWDKQRFPNPGPFVDRMKAKGVRVNLWCNPYIAPKTPLHAALAPYAGSHTVWNGIVPDYTLPEARNRFANHLKRKQIALGPGIGGFKIDEVDGHDFWLWPDTADFPSGHDAEQLRQTYGLLVQRIALDLFRETNRRTYGLARGTNAGSPPLPFVLYSDSYSFDGYITALCNSGFSGILWCPEVRAARTPEEWVRRIQAVCFSPMAMLNAWANATKPWTFPEVSDAVRSVMLLRMRLLPYLYTAFARYHFDGTPPVRPMQLVEGFAENRKATRGALDDTKNPYETIRIAEVKDQFLLGDDLLVAPIAPGAKSRTVALPPGKWFDFYTGALAGEQGVITVTPPLDRIPLFVRDGGLIPLIPERLHAPGPNETVPLEVRHYGDRDGDFRLYDDDGETFDYEKGVFTWTRLRAQKSADGTGRGTVEPSPTGSRPTSYGPITWTFMG